MVKKIEGGVTAATGFKAGGIYSGIKQNSEKPDLALISQCSSGKCRCGIYKE